MRFQYSKFHLDSKIQKEILSSVKRNFNRFITLLTEKDAKNNQYSNFYFKVVYLT